MLESKMATRSTTAPTDLRAPLPLTARRNTQSKAAKAAKLNTKSLADTVKESASKSETTNLPEKSEIFSSAIAQGKEPTGIVSNHGLVATDQSQQTQQHKPGHSTDSSLLPPKVPPLLPPGEHSFVKLAEAINSMHTTMITNQAYLAEKMLLRLSQYS